MAFSPDGKQVLTGSSDNTAILWEAATGQKLHAFDGHESEVESVAFSPDGKRVLTGSADGTAILWDAASGQKVRAFAGHDGAVMSVAFSPDGKQVLTGSYDKTATLWEAASGQKHRDFAGHESAVEAVAFSPDGKQVLTGSRDGTTRLWDVATGDELARLIRLGQGREWAVVTPEGLFDGSKGGREQVAFRVGNGLDVVPLDRFFQDFYSPGLLAEIWRGERPLPGKSLPISPAPLIKMLVNDESRTEGRSAQVTIDVTVAEQGGGVKGPWLQHNRATLPSGTLVKTEGKTAHYRFVVSLVPGDNRLEVRAATGDGVRESDPAMLTIPFSGKLPEPDLYVVAVGINHYAKDSGIGELDFCVPDTQAIARLFRQRAGKLFRQVHLTQLLDEQATKEGILQAIADCAKKAQPQDTLVLYVGGHGIAVGQRFYLIPRDFRVAQAVQPQEPARTTISGLGLRGYRDVSGEREAAVRQHGLAIDELGEELAKVPALKRVLIFDTCHSGSAIQLAGKKQNPFAFRGAVERFSRAQGVYSLSATAADELAAETKELGHSILTYSLLAGAGAADQGPLAGQTAGGKEALDVLAWFGFARQRVPALYERYVGRPQHVELSGDDQPTFPLLSLEAK